MKKNSGIKQFGRLIGGHPRMLKLYRLIDKAATVNIPVLIVGETGTGKELVAREIHDRSQCKGLFVPLNTGGLSKELITSELFGHRKGAFTGAVDRNPGLFHEARCGTLFLDEIGTMDHFTQVTLLRVLEYGKYRMVGSSKEIKAEARVLAAINVSPSKAVQNGKLRRDLLHRLQVFRILIPPLRKRDSDIEILTRFFIRHYAKEFEMKVTDIDDNALQLLNKYGWPGNVRELKNVMAQSVIICDEKTITEENIPPRIRHYEPPDPSKKIDDDDETEDDNDDDEQEKKGDNILMPLGPSLDEIEKIYTIRILEKCGNNKTMAADILGISRKALYDKLAKWGL